MLLDISMCHLNVIRKVCPRLCLGVIPPDPPVATHAYACYYHPATIVFPPSLQLQLKILYEALVAVATINTCTWHMCTPIRIFAAKLALGLFMLYDLLPWLTAGLGGCTNH